MNLSNIISVALGLVLMYYVLSLIVSYITSAISRTIQMRAKDLNHVLHQRIEDPETYEKLMKHPLIKNIKPMNVTVMGQKIWEGEVESIPMQTFAGALLDTLAPETREEDKLEYVREAIKSLPEGEFKESLSCKIDATVKDIQTARQKIGEWYDDTMQNVSRLYTQHARHIAIITALVVAIALDADSITVANRLWAEPTLRAAAAVKAQEYVNAAPNPEQADVVTYVGQLEELELPILWSVPTQPTLPNWALKIFGWAITWVAIAQGSSFWYDILKRVRSVSSDSSDGK